MTRTAMTMSDSYQISRLTSLSEWVSWLKRWKRLSLTRKRRRRNNLQPRKKYSQHQWKLEERRKNVQTVRIHFFITNCMVFQRLVQSQLLKMTQLQRPVNATSAANSLRAGIYVVISVCTPFESVDSYFSLGKCLLTSIIQDAVVRALAGDWSLHTEGSYTNW